MTPNNHLAKISQILDALSEELDVSPAKYREAEAHYESVGQWLDADDSNLAGSQPSIYPQGSFALGTAVKPLGNEEYDVDAVCLLQLTREQVSQPKLKRMVGDRLKHPSSRYKEMIDPKDGGRRCWTIRFAESSKFHLDILPAIPDPYLRQPLPTPGSRKWTDTGILLTDRKTWNNPAAQWPRSNPKGFAAWFKEQMRVSLNQAKEMQAKEIRAEVETIEDLDVRTPLQRLIQILKRHRDVRYNGDADKPISIIITTLAARAYENESSVNEAMSKVVPKMLQYIETRNGIIWVPNPVNQEENFADKWTEKPRKKELFFDWIRGLQEDYSRLVRNEDLSQVGDYLNRSFGAHVSKTVVRKLHLPMTAFPTVIVSKKPERSTTPRIKIPAQASKPWGVGKWRKR